MPFDRRMREVLAAQDASTRWSSSTRRRAASPRVIGSIVDYLFAPDDPEAVIERMADPATRIVSLTVTEGGYNFAPGHRRVRRRQPRRPADLAGRRAAGDDVRPRHRGAASAAGTAGVPPFTVMSCDNIQGNGDVAAQDVHRVRPAARPRPGRLDRARGARSPTRWSTGSPRSPPTRTGPRSAERFGVEDAWPVVCEPFTQWVLEDSFAARPARLRGRRRAGGRRRRAVRADEAAAAQRRPPGAVLLRLPGRLPVRPRGRPGPAVRRLPAGATWTARRRRPCRRCPASTWTPTSTS